MIKIQLFFLIILLWRFCGSEIVSEENNETTENNLEVFATLSYDFEEKLDKLVESFEQLQNSNYILRATIKIMQDELELLREEQEKSLISFAKAGEEKNAAANINVLQVECEENRIPDSCYEVKKCKKDIYNIMIPNYPENPQTVSCDLETDKGGWTVIQRRKDGTVNFNRNWTDYVEGFGHVDGEFFIGLEKLHQLTKDKPQELYIILKDFEGVERYAKYSTFTIGSEQENYKLTVSGYSGNAGDSLTYHNGQHFSTWDDDNDISTLRNCGKIYNSGWWFKDCYHSNLNGKYLMGKILNSFGFSWYTFRGQDYSLKFSQMMIRPRGD